MEQNGSFIKTLKSSGPRMGSCRAPKSRIWNTLWTLVMFTDCFDALGINIKK